MARAVATALHERPQLLASASGRDDEVDAILLGLQRASSRIWVVDRRYQVIAAAGSLRRADRRRVGSALVAAAASAG